MAVCGSCSTVLAESVVACDGVCGNSFHSSCLRRTTRASASGATTCTECADIKPCHVLRLVRGMLEAFSVDQSLIADKMITISSFLPGLQFISDDIHAVRVKIDGLQDAVGGLATNSDLLLERSHILSSKVSGLSRTLDDLQVSFAGLDWASLAPGVDTPPVLPILDDIRRNVGQFKGDFGAWSSAVAANSKLIGTIAAEVRALASRREVISSSPPTCTTISVPLDVTDAAGASPPTVVQDIARSPSLASPRRSDREFTSPSAPLSPQDAGVCSPLVRLPASLELVVSEPRRSLLESSPTPVAACSGAVGTALDVDLIPVAVSPPSAGGPPPSSSRLGGRRSTSSATSQPIPSMPDVSPTAQSGHRRRSCRRKRGGRNRAPQSTADAVVAVDPGSSGPPLSSGVVSLRPARRHRCVFVSRVDPDTTEDEIIHHISSHIGVPREVISCSRLGSSRSRVGCSFTASFRVFVPEDMFSAVVSSDTWPDDSIVREFLPRQRPSALSKNSLVSSPSTTPT